MKRSSQRHSIENVFVLVLFAIFAMTIVAVLALGANQYKSLVERDNNAYNKRIITSYVSAQIRGYDRADAVKVGGFASPDVDDEVNTLHLLETIDGIRYDLKIYYYQGKVYELFAAEESELYDLAELFKVFGDSTRIRILFVLFEAEVCVCDLAKVLNMTQSAISHQLRILKANKLVNSRREGKSVFYSLADGHVRTIIAQGREHIEE